MIIATSNFGTLQKSFDEKLIDSYQRWVSKSRVWNLKKCSLIYIND